MICDVSEKMLSNVFFRFSCEYGIHVPVILQNLC